MCPTPISVQQFQNKGNLVVIVAYGVPASYLQMCQWNDQGLDILPLRRLFFHLCSNQVDRRQIWEADDTLGSDYFKPSSQLKFSYLGIKA